MKNVFRILPAFLLASVSIYIYSCEKQSIEEPLADESESSEKHTLAQEEEEKCYVKGVIYHGYIKCLDPGDNCEVACDPEETTPPSVETFFNSLNPSNNNTSSIKNFMSSLTYIAPNIQQSIQSATTLDFLITTHSGSTSYAVLDSQGAILYAFSY